MNVAIANLLNMISAKHITERLLTQLDRVGGHCAAWLELDPGRRRSLRLTGNMSFGPLLPGCRSAFGAERRRHVGLNGDQCAIRFVRGCLGLLESDHQPLAGSLC